MTDDVDSQAYFPWDSLVTNKKSGIVKLLGRAELKFKKLGAALRFVVNHFLRQKLGSGRTHPGFSTGQIRVL
jgi:hypothetical protein